MKLFSQITSAARRVVRDVADAPRVSRELRAYRAADASAAAPARVPAPLTEVDGEVPAVETIEQAAKEYEQAREATNAASRLKRRAEKILKRTPDGAYGSVVVERFESSRQTADLDAIKAIFKANGLGDIPMKTCSPSLVITWAAEQAAPEQVDERVLVAA